LIHSQDDIGIIDPGTARLPQKAALGGLI